MRWNKRLKLKRFSTLAIVCSLSLLMLFAAFTIYGNKVGNFVIAIGDTNDGAELSLSMTEDLSDATSRLTVEMLSTQTNATYSWLPEDISSGLGVKNDTAQNFYSAFSFYLCNLSDRYPADYDMILSVSNVVGDPLSVLRICVITGDGDLSSGTVYAKPEDSEEGEKKLAMSTSYTTTSFLDGKQIIKERIYDLQPLQRTKYTVVMWIEGNDIDCTNERQSDRIRMNLDFVGITSKN